VTKGGRDRDAKIKIEMIIESLVGVKSKFKFCFTKLEVFLKNFADFSFFKPLFVNKLKHFWILSLISKKKIFWLPKIPASV